MNTYEWQTKVLPEFEDFRKIVLQDIPLIDVRANVEFKKGSFPNAVNIPLMNDEQRHLVGTKYAQDGKDEAIVFANSLVTPKIKGQRIAAWEDFILKNPNAMLFCFRGGMRSKISQYWIYENLNKEIPRLKGGYKAFRNFLIESYKPQNISLKPVVVSGYTGSGKTILLQSIENALDLEKLAHHRGSTFGRFANAQPSQIDFENALASDIIKLHAHDFEHMILEDESRHIGLSFIDDDLFAYFKSGDWIFLETPLEKRVEIIAQEYIFQSQLQYMNYYKENPLTHWLEDIEINLEKIQKKLGYERYRVLKDILSAAFNMQITHFGTEVKDQPAERINAFYYDFIEIMLTQYYDKMYEYQMKQKPKPPVFKGGHDETLEFIKNEMK